MNVGEGDCTWINHNSGHNTIIDVSCAKQIVKKSYEASSALDSHDYLGGNYNQKAYPDNPIVYLQKFGVESVFRFILTHPDMDHMDGIKIFFDTFSPINFWDTDNNKTMSSGSWNGKYDKADWDFYQSIRKESISPKVLHIYAGNTGKYFNEDENGKGDGDGLYILAPTIELITAANESGDYNNCSYVLLYRTSNYKILFAGDSGEDTWDYIITNYSNDVSNIDVLIAPHHGRATGGNDDYLDTLNPRLSLLGNAASEYIDYNAWLSRDLLHFTNNQAGNIILDIQPGKIRVLFSNETFAKKCNNYCYDNNFDAYFVGELQ